MKILNLLDTLDLDKLTLEDASEKSDRREIFRLVGSWTKKIAIGTVPFAAASLSSNKAFAAGEGILEVLNFALLLEYLENEFYEMGLDSGIIPSGDAQKVFMQIGKHEAQHVAFLKTAIGSLGGTAIDKPAFDFTAKGNFSPFTNYQQFLILSQAFEDTGVRAYKGQAANLQESKPVLTAALQIHSVEARHASEVRRIRGLMGWISQAGDSGTGVAAVEPVYRGEGNTKQGGIEVTNVTAVEKITITEAFDEPLSKAEVTAIASLFLA